MNRICYIFFSICFLGCKPEDDAIKADFLIDKPDSLDIIYTVSKHEINNLNLRDLEIGVDSLVLRIWYEEELWIGGDYMLDIKIDKDGRKNGFLYRYWSKQVDYSEMRGDNIYELFAKIDSFIVKNVVPKSGWDNFLKQLQRENIYDLPSENNIPGFKSRHTDGYTWIVEVATKNSYRFYYYGTPYIYAKEFRECAQMIKITETLWKEFGFANNPDSLYKWTVVR